MVWLKRDRLHRVFAALGQPEDTSASAVPALESPRRDVGEVSATAPQPVSDRIRRLIDSGQFPPGSRLPSERVLAAQLEVGRPSVREALKVLSGFGIIETRKRSGTFVRALDAGNLAGTSGAGGTRIGVIELLEARRILEPRGAWLAATRATERDLLGIESARHRLEGHVNDWNVVAHLDCELHIAIIRAARNPALELMYQALMSHAFASQQLMPRFAPDLNRMRRDHKAIVDAILTRQADAAEKAMAEHLQSLGLDYISEASR